MNHFDVALTLRQSEILSGVDHLRQHAEESIPLEAGVLDRTLEGNLLQLTQVLLLEFIITL
jgi:hypothetical protein